MKSRWKIWASITALMAISGCTQYPIAMTAETFETIIEGRYDPSKQGLLADCIFDGWDTVMNYAAFSQARLVKRAWGYRVDSISMTNKLMAAELRDDGIVTISRMKERRMVTTLVPETTAATACLTRYGATFTKVGGP
ncbi:MAG: hypothetical protein V4645_00515 [Pseudomonadota bacterium]